MTDRRQVLLELHRRVLANDPVASADLFQSIHGPLIGVLMRSPDLVNLATEEAADLATDAILEYLRDPTKYDPDRAGLYSYLAMIAKSDAINFLQSRKRHKKGFRKIVELSAAERNLVEESADSELDATRILSKYGSELVDDEMDAAVLRLMLAGEKDTEAYAAALRIEGEDFETKKALVKQRRDKLEKRLRRLGEVL